MNSNQNIDGRHGRAPDVEAPKDLEQRLRELLPDEQLHDALEGLTPGEVTGQGGLLQQLAGRLLSAALEGEMTAHLGYPRGQAPPDGLGGPNHRNGHVEKTVATPLGDTTVRTPRDRAGDFDPVVVKKRQTRVGGLDEQIIGMYAGGMSVREIEHQMAGIYGVGAVKRDTISSVTDAVLDDVQAWRTRPLDPMYPIIYLDAIHVKMRADRSVTTRACYLAIGVTTDGTRETLGLWWQDNEGAKFWLAVLSDLKRRGVNDVLIACCDGLAGFQDAIEAVFPQAWTQTCIVHQIRNSLRYVPDKDRKQVARDLKPIYTALDADDALAQLERFETEWGQKYPMIGPSWHARWDQITPFLALPDELRRIVYTTNAIEALNRQIRKVIKTRGHFPDEQAASKLIYLAITRAETKWRRTYGWAAARLALKIHFGDRYPDHD